MTIGDIKYLEAPVKITKLSEAIRIGSKIRPQCFGTLFSDGKSCALGAAHEAMGWGRIEGWGDGYGDQYLRLWKGFGEELCDRVDSRNDSGESRESIADWLESQGF